MSVNGIFYKNQELSSLELALTSPISPSTHHQTSLMGKCHAAKFTGGDADLGPWQTKERNPLPNVGKFKLDLTISLYNCKPLDKLTAPQSHCFPFPFQV